MIGLDTNVLLRWLLADDSNPEQSQIAEATIADAGDDIWIGPVVLAELSWVMRRNFGLGRAELVKVLDRLLAAPRFVIADRPSVERAVANFAKGGPGFSDHLIGALNAAVGCQTTLTFDKSAAKSPHFTQLA